MTGTQADFVRRLRMTLPDGWVADEAPLLDAVLGGLGAAWEAVWTLLAQVRMQSRLATVSGSLLDLACIDFFAWRVRRRAGEGDDALRTRLMRRFRREAGTRAALVATAAEAGWSVRVFEAARPLDTGAYGVAAGLAWGVAGGWGSLQMPLECLVVARATGGGAQPLGPALVDVLPAGGAAWVRFE